MTVLLVMKVSNTCSYSVARLGKKAPVGLYLAAIGTLKFGFGALLLFQPPYFFKCWRPVPCRLCAVLETFFLILQNHS